MEETESGPKVKFRYSRIVFFALIILVLLILVGFYFYDKPIVTGGTTIEESNLIAAKVNGEIINVTEIDNRLNLSKASFPLATREMILNDTITEVLLLQEARNQGITATDKEVSDYIMAYLNQQKITLGEEAFNATLKSQNMTVEDFISRFKESIRRQLIVLELLNETVLYKINVTETDIQDFYNKNIDEFKEPEKLQTRHILICYAGSSRCNSNRTKIEAKEFTEELLTNIKTGNNSLIFEEYAINYSDCPSAQIGGKLDDFSRGMMVKEFEDAAYALKLGEISSVIETEFGFHIIQLYGIVPPRTRYLAEVKSDIQSYLLQQKQTLAVQAYMQSLTRKANITIYDLSSPAKTIPLNTPEACVKAHKVMLFGANWSTYVTEQKDKLGQLMDSVIYVECYNNDVKLDICSDITAFPTWYIDGKKIEKVLSKDEIIAYCDC